MIKGDWRERLEGREGTEGDRLLRDGGKERRRD